MIRYGERRPLATPLEFEHPAQQIASEWAGNVRHKVITPGIALSRAAKNANIKPVGDALEPPDVASTIRFRHEHQVRGLVADQVADQWGDRVVEPMTGRQLVEQ